MKNPIICISREYGSGGREIGQRVAKQLGVPFYDRQIIDKAAEESGLSPEFIEKEEQTFNNSMLLNLSMGSHTLSATGLDLSNQVFDAERKVICHIATQGSCVIVGRCADFILRNHPELFTVFIAGDFDCRVQRITQLQEAEPSKVSKTVRTKDKQRARHYSFYSDRTWGDKANYHMILNSSKLGIDTCVALICNGIQSQQ